MVALPEPGTRWEYGRGTVVDGVDDLAAVDPFEEDARDAEVRVAELALDDDQRYAFGGHLDRVRVAQLMRSEATADASGHC